MSIKQLASEHRDHLISEGFSDDLIEKFTQDGLIESLTADSAYSSGYGVAIDGKQVTGGLQFKFSPTFGQLRLDDTNIIPKDRNNPGKFAKYISLGGDVDHSCAYIPEGCNVVTEGMKDALAFTHIGGIPTGAIAGVSHATKALPKGCGYTIVYDSDAWNNFEVFINLIRAGVHCNGKVGIIPQIEGYPKAGGCEYFNYGKTQADYKQLIDSSLTPIKIFQVWFDRQEIIDISTAVTLAVNASKLIGEIYGYASSGAVEHIKQILKNSKLSDWNLTLSNILRDSNNTQKSLKAKQRDEDETDTRNAVKIATELVKERAQLFHSPFPDLIEYASIPSKTGVMTTHEISSREFKSWVTGEFYSQVGEGLTNESMNTVLANIYAIAAHDSPELPVSEKRIVEHNSRYYLYLADENQTVIEYSSTGWNICENSPVKFVFDKYKAPLPIPIKNGSIDKLWILTRIKDTNESPDRLMIISALVKGLVPGGSDLILAISGYAGSGKTTTAKYLRALIDPFTKGKVLSKLPENSDNIAIHCMKRRIFAIDNISHITKEQSDFLCNVTNVDSGGTSKRELHTNSNEIIHDIQNLIIITSIGNVVNQPDLLERSIVIDLPRLTTEDRESESELAQMFDRHHGEILGGLLDITVSSLHHRDNTKCPKFNRLTEFAHLGVGVEKFLNYTIGSIEQRFIDNANIAHEIAIDASPVASTLRSWILDRQEPWNGTTSDLLNILKTHAKKSELAGTLPKTANSLAGELKKCESALFESGVIIEDFRESRANDPSQTRKKIVYMRSHPPKTCPNHPPHPPHPQNTKLELLLDNGSSRGEQNENHPPHIRLSDVAENMNNSTKPLLDNGSSRGGQMIEQMGEQITDDEYPYTDDV